MHTENTILFTLVYRNEEYRVQTNRHQYHTLMTLISDWLAIPGFGLCCGMGSCGTCMVGICTKHAAVQRHTLSCDVQISDELANTIVIVPSIIY